MAKLIVKLLKDKDKLQAQGASEGAVNNDNKQDSSSTIIKYDGCYSKWDDPHSPLHPRS